MTNITIRPATPEDIPTIYHFIQELAAYEHLENEVVATEELLTEWIFEKGMAKVNLAFVDDEPAELCQTAEFRQPVGFNKPAGFGKPVEFCKPVGFTLYCYNFSTFLGRAGIWLEDLFVLPEFRGRGIGLALMRALAKEAVDGGFGRLEWYCLDWNTPSLDFYHKRLGAIPMDEWTTQRLTGKALRKLAEEK